MIKPRIKGKWFTNDIWGCTDLMWTHNYLNWFHNTSTAIECAYQDQSVILER